MRGNLIAVFISTHETMRAEKVFKGARIKIRAVIKPRNISSRCQMALSFPEEKLADIMDLVQSNSFDLSGYFRRDEEGNWIEEKQNF